MQRRMWKQNSCMLLTISIHYQLNQTFYKLFIQLENIHPKKINLEDQINQKIVENYYSNFHRNYYIASHFPLNLENVAFSMKYHLVPPLASYLLFQQDQ